MTFSCVQCLKNEIPLCVSSHEKSSVDTKTFVITGFERQEQQRPISTSNTCKLGIYRSTKPKEIYLRLTNLGYIQLRA
jgi:hypothetical protein